jgi:hypothetical protein
METPVRGITWQIKCDKNLIVTLAVVERQILLLSAEALMPVKWRIGTYASTEEAHRYAVEMTGSYERLRKGQVGDPIEFFLHQIDWNGVTEHGEVPPAVNAAIMDSIQTLSRI